MMQKIDRKRGILSTTTTCGDLLAAVLATTANQREALAMFKPNSPLQRRLKTQILFTR